MSYSPLFNEVNDLSSSTLFGHQVEATQGVQIGNIRYANIHPQLVRSGSDILFGAGEHSLSQGVVQGSDEYYAEALRPNGFDAHQHEYSHYGPMLSNPVMRNSLSHEFQMSYHDVYNSQPNHMQQHYQHHQTQEQQNEIHMHQLQQLQNSNQKISNSSQETNNMTRSKDSLFIPMNDILPSDVYPSYTDIQRKATLLQQESSATLMQIPERDDPEVWALLEGGQDAFFRKCTEIVAELRLLNPEKYPLYDSANKYSHLNLGVELAGSESGKVKTTKRGRGKSHTPRPSNSFILYRKSKHALIMSSYHAPKPLNNNFISKMVAKWWKEETPENKLFWSRNAEEEKRIHSEKYPDYKYRPKKSMGKNSSEVFSGQGSARQSRMERDSAESVADERGGQYRSVLGGMYGVSMGYYGTPIAPNPNPSNQGSYTNNYSIQYPYAG